jgi:hypothetical protein
VIYGQLLFVSVFDDFSPAIWKNYDPNSVATKGSVLRLTEKDGAGFMPQRQINSDESIVLIVAVSPNATGFFSLESPSGDNNKQWMINLVSDDSNVYISTHLKETIPGFLDRQLNQSFPIKINQWFVITMSVSSNLIGTIQIATIDSFPDKLAEFQLNLDPSWSNDLWDFRIGMDNGEFYLDNFYRIELVN